MLDRNIGRRRFLALTGAGFAGALAGCPGGNGGTETTTPAGTTGGDPTNTTTVRPTTTLAPTTSTGGGPTTTGGGPTETGGGPTTTTTSTTPPPTTTITSTATPVPVTTEYQDDVLSESETETAGFGAAVAFDENTALIGAPLADTDGPGTGLVYVYVRESGRWSREDVLAPEDGAEGETFGAAVAVDGDIAVVGAPPAEGSDDATGSAYAFSRTYASWSQQGVLDPGDLAAGAAFGETAAIAGTTGMVGAPSAGEVHVFSASGGRWSHDATITGAETDDDRFGSALDVQNAVVVIGAGRATPEGAENAGAVYVYESGSGGWSRTFTITPDESVAGDRFGEDVAIGSEYLVAGAPGADATGDTSGAAYVFEAERGEWPQEDTLVATDGDADDDFGRSVVLTGQTAIVGAPRDEDPDGPDAGSAYVFFGDVPAWRQEAKLLPSEGRPDAGFGAAIAVVGQTVLVGTDAVEGVPGAGYVFDR